MRQVPEMDQRRVELYVPLIMSYLFFHNVDINNCKAMVSWKLNTGPPATGFLLVTNTWTKERWWEHIAGSVVKDKIVLMYVNSGLDQISLNWSWNPRFFWFLHVKTRKKVFVVQLLEIVLKAHSEWGQDT